MNKRPISAAWTTAVNEFLDVLRAGGTPATTAATRRAHLHRVARGLGGSPFSVEGDALVAWCGRQDWSPETRRGVRGTLLAFYRWAVSAGRTDTNPAEDLPRVRPSIPRPRPASEADYATALLAARTPAHRVMLRFAAEAGLRRAEVARVHTRDLIADLEGVSVYVHGKGGRDRVVPLTASLAAEARGLVERGYLFPGADDGHLSPRWVGKIVADLLPGEVTMHQLRHRFATIAYGIDRDTFTVQSLLGHASPDTTRRYVAVPVEGLRRTVEAVGRTRAA